MRKEHTKQMLPKQNRGAAHSFSTRARRAGVGGTLSAALLLVLAACGNEPAAIQPTPTTGTTLVPTATTAVAAPVGTVVITADEAPPSALETQLPIAVITSEAEPTPTAATSNSVIEVGAVLQEWSLDLTEEEVSGGKVRFTVTNGGQFPHNLTVTDSTGSQLAATSNFTRGDGAQAIEVDLAPGTYTVICSIPGHANRGQTAELTVK